MWFNPIMIWLARSPLHGLVSKQVMLITYTGRKSGQTYTIPVNYIQNGDQFLTTSYRQRTWWRNLRGGASATIRVQGRNLKAVTETVEEVDAVAENLMTLFRIAPQYARYYAVTLEEDGRPNPQEVVKAAQDRVIVRTRVIGA